MPIHVLLAEGAIVEARQIIKSVESELLAVEWSPTGRKLLNRLDERWGALIVGEALDWPVAADLVEFVRGRGYRGGIVALAGELEPATLARLLRAGVYEVLPRSSGYYPMLPRLLLRAIEQVALRRQFEQARSEVRRLARELAQAKPTNQVTGLPDGWYFTALDRVERERARRTGRTLSTVTVRLAGTNRDAQRLVRLADVLRTHARATDVVGHASPDALVVLLPETDAPDAWLFIRRVVATLHGEGESEVTFAVEAAACPERAAA